MMDLQNVLRQIEDRIARLCDSIRTEEATKNALIMPFIQALGYDVFNPLEVVPEYTCDVGFKRGEKVDYAILHNGTPAILIECKHWQQNLNLHGNQLVRYFNVSQAKLGILTNGIEYRFFTDLKEPNKMDEQPFFTINLAIMRDAQVEELQKFHKAHINFHNLSRTAGELRYTADLKSLLLSELTNPSEEFVRYFVQRTYSGRTRKDVLCRFGGLLQKSAKQLFGEMGSDLQKPSVDSLPDEPGAQEIPAQQEYQASEQEAYTLVKAILGQHVDTDKLSDSPTDTPA